MLRCACRVNLQHMDPTGLLGMQVLQQDVKQPDGSDGQQTLVLCCSPSRKYFRGIATHVNNCIQVGAADPWQRGAGASACLHMLCCAHMLCSSC